MAEYKAAREAELAKTERLRALRLAVIAATAMVVQTYLMRR